MTELLELQHKSGIMITIPTFENREQRDYAVADAKMLLSVMLMSQDLEKDKREVEPLPVAEPKEDKRKRDWTAQRRSEWSTKMLKVKKRKGRLSRK